jgi:hypothetical protein
MTRSHTSFVDERHRHERPVALLEGDGAVVPMTGHCQGESDQVGIDSERIPVVRWRCETKVPTCSSL